MVKLVRSFRTSGRLLEIGCGDGILSALLSNVFDITAVDISSAAIEKASKLVHPDRLRVMDIEKGDLGREYDIVLALNVLEHLRHPGPAILKIRESLQKGGLFIFSVPNNYYLGKVATLIMGLVDRTHISALTRDEWTALLKMSDFKTVQILNGIVLRPFKQEFAKYFASTMVVIAERLPNNNFLDTNR